MPPPTSLEFFWNGLFTWFWIIASVTVGSWILRAVLLNPTLQALHRIARALENRPP